ncbi:hypothetical protein GPALN_014608 [Globodera pallida]|nr:hypothetical protein GPALN_014608 [Globodera pallida]
MQSHQQRRLRHSSASARIILARYGFEFPENFKLGNGRYSKVYKAFHNTAGRYFAIKITDLESVSARFKQKFLPRELSIWRELNHPNLVRLYKDFVKSNYLFEIIDLAVGGDMLTYVRDNGPIEEKKCLGWMLQLTDALEYLHCNQISHRDLKLENILIFEAGIIKITDYGFCKQGADLSTTFCGTKSYKAPEILQGIEYDTFKVDIWSFGVVGFVLLTNVMPFRGDVSNAQIVEAQRNRRYKFPSRLGLSQLCRSAIDTLLTFEPNLRPNISDCLKLPWFTSADGTESSTSRGNARCTQSAVAAMDRARG